MEEGKEERKGESKERRVQETGGLRKSMEGEEGREWGGVWEKGGGRDSRKEKRRGRGTCTCIQDGTYM